LHGLQRLFVGCELRLVLVVAGVYGRGRKELVSDPPTPMTGAPLVAETAKAAGGRALAPGMVWIPAGTFLMGSDSHYPDEAPAPKVSIDGFWIDRFTRHQPRVRPIRGRDRPCHRRRGLEAVWGEAVEGRDVQVLYRPRAGGQGQRHGRSVSEAAGERDRVVCGRNVPDPGVESDPKDLADAARPCRATHPRLRREDRRTSLIVSGREHDHQLPAAGR